MGRVRFIKGKPSDIPAIYATGGQKVQVFLRNEDLIVVPEIEEEGPLPFGDEEKVEYLEAPKEENPFLDFAKLASDYGIKMDDFLKEL